MKPLSEQELELKINRFLNDRFAAHPDLAELTSPKTSRRVVSRVKNTMRKIAGTPQKSRTIFQSQA